MTKFEEFLQETELQEGFWKSDSRTKTFYGNTKDEVLGKAKEFTDKFPDYNPKLGHVTTTTDGRFQVIVAYQKDADENDKSVRGLAKKGLGFAKKAISKGIETHKQAVSYAKSDGNGNAVADIRSKLSSLSPEQLAAIQKIIG